MSIILEEAESVTGDRIATVRTKRGEELVVNIDKAVCALVEMLSDYDNERRQGWVLQAPWFEAALGTIRGKAVESVVPDETASTPAEDAA